jgi:hypothetical protein
MKSKRRPAKHTSRESDTHLELTNLLFCGAANFCRSIGVAPSTIRAARVRAGRTSKPVWVPLDHAALRMLPTVGRMLRRWHTDAEFTDSSGAPSALPLVGPSSVTTLAELEHPDDPAELRRMAVSFGALKRSRAGWLPTDRNAIMRSTTTPALAYAAMAVIDLLSTITENVTSRPERSRKRFERTVSQGELRKRDIPLFERFVAEQGRLFIDSVDDWLEHHRAPDTSDVALAVGANAFAWVADGKRPELARRPRKKPKQLIPRKQGNG